MSWNDTDRHKALYATNTRIEAQGSGGGMVSFHEFNAISTHPKITVDQRYEHLPGLVVENAYPGNPFMFDYFISTLLKNPSQIELAHFYNGFFTNTMKRLEKAKILMTIPAHNQEVSLEEWRSFTYWSAPPIHLTDPYIFDLSWQGLREDVDKIICPSKMSADYINSKLNKPNLEIAIIPHGVDLPQGNRSYDRGEFKVLNIGQFGPDKGVRYLVAAWQKLNYGLSKLTLAGNGRALDLVPPGVMGVVCPGYLTEQQKDREYDTASVYVQPSVTEGFGLPVLEAMAHGTPVIVSAGTGASELVTDGEEGFIVPIRDSEAIASKIQYFYEHPTETQRMGMNASTTARKYEWPKVEEAYQRLYTEMLQ